MPSILLPVPELNISTIRPIVLSVVDQLMKITGIPKDTKVLFPNSGDETYQKGSAQQQDPNKFDNYSFPHNEQVFIELEESYDEDKVLATAVKRAEHIPIFNDPNLGVLIKPVYSANNMTLNIKYRSPSQTRARQWRDSIRVGISNMRDVNMHDVQYHYAIPFEIMYLLKEIHRLRENVAGYGDSLEEYYAGGFTTKATVIANQSGEFARVAIAEKQTQIQAIYDFEVAPEKPEKNNDVSVWTYSFAYKFRVEVPTSINVVYPIMVHNQPMHTRFLPPTPTYSQVGRNRAYSLSGGYNSHFSSTDAAAREEERSGVIYIPKEDGFSPTSKPVGTTPIISLLCGVDTNTPKLIQNLENLGTHQIDSDILKFIREVEYPFITKPYKSIISVTLHKWSALTGSEAINCTANLDVVSVEDLSLRVNHRLLIGVFTQIELLDATTLRRLLPYPLAAKKLLTAAGVTMYQLKLIKHRADFTKLMSHLPDVGASLESIRDNSIQYNTVNSAFVRAVRLD